MFHPTKNDQFARHAGTCWRGVLENLGRCPRLDDADSWKICRTISFSIHERGNKMISGVNPDRRVLSGGWFGRVAVFTHSQGDFVMRKLIAVSLLLVVPVIFLSAEAADKEKMATGPTKAIVTIHPAGKSKVHGIITFTQKDGYIEIAGEVTGLTPGLHGFHVHEFGDCSMPDALCAGGHFNPTGAPHGAPDSAKRHVGDLGNIKAGDDGKAVVSMKDKVIALHGTNSIIGRGIIIHAKADDLKTQPTGDAGARVGCGVIGIANPKPMMKK